MSNVLRNESVSKNSAGKVIASEVENSVLLCGFSVAHLFALPLSLICFYFITGHSVRCICYLIIPWPYSFTIINLFSSVAIQFSNVIINHYFSVFHTHISLFCIRHSENCVASKKKTKEKKEKKNYCNV